MFTRKPLVTPYGDVRVTLIYVLLALERILAKLSWSMPLEAGPSEEVSDKRDAVTWWRYITILAPIPFGGGDIALSLRSAARAERDIQMNSWAWLRLWQWSCDAPGGLPLERRRGYEVMSQIFFLKLQQQPEHNVIWNGNGITLTYLLSVRWSLRFIGIS